MGGLGASRGRHTRLQGDWSSDVCSSDLGIRRCRWGRACWRRQPARQQVSGSAWRAPFASRRGIVHYRPLEVISTSSHLWPLWSIVSAMRQQIGRASCRERWVVWVRAEDGIRDYKVTGVQTCALPISVFGAVVGVGLAGGGSQLGSRFQGRHGELLLQVVAESSTIGRSKSSAPLATCGRFGLSFLPCANRSEERRVGRDGWSGCEQRTAYEITR